MVTERVVLFIDILGFSEYVLNHSSQDCYKILNDFNYKFANLNNSMQAALQHQLENESSEMSIQLEDYKHHILSDSIIITANSDNDRRMIASLLILIYRLSGIQFEMLRKNLPIRGAISLGGFYNRKIYTLERV